jgi:DNA-binding protein YbaB
MAATIERAKAEDPRELRRQLAEAQRKFADAQKEIARLQATSASRATTDKATGFGELKRRNAQLQRALGAATKILVTIKAVDFLVDTEADRKALETAVAAAVVQVTKPIEKRVTALIEKVEGVKTAAAGAEKAIAALLAEPVDLSVSVVRREPFAVATERARPTSRRSAPPIAQDGGGKMGKGERVVLAAVAQYPEGAARDQLTVLTGYK